jgi:toxin ParE1/3/4
MRNYRVTPAARDDLNNIGRYTLLKWGKAQRNTYLKNLETRFAWLADNPLLGKHRTDINEGFYCFPQGEHLVFYMMQPEGIAIIGIAHKEMDVFNYFRLS